MDPETLLHFWFGELEHTYAFPEEKFAVWWGKGHDEEIRARFGDWLEQAKRGALDAWAESPRSTLALVLLFDQITRTVHRGTPEAFAWDARARALTDAALARGFDQALRPIERLFLFMPLMHSESLDDHDRITALFEALIAAVPEDADCREALEKSLESGHQHRDIVARFGRYPHRNEILGRASTEEERAFLEQPGSSF